MKQQPSQKLKNYVSGLDHRINRILEMQSHLIVRKEAQIKKELQVLRDNNLRLSRPRMKMQEYFLKYCESLLTRDIHNNNHHQLFYQQLFLHYQNQIKMQIQLNRNRKLSIDQLKQRLLNNIKNVNSSIKLSTQKSALKAVASLPILKNKIFIEKRPLQLKSSNKTYMEKIGKLRTVKNNTEPQLIKMLKWFKDQQTKGNSLQKNLMYRIMFADKYFKRLLRAIGPIKGKFNTQL